MVGANFCIRMCKAAGLTASDKCIACGEHEDHLHLFKQCPFYAQTRPPDVFQCSTWCTGIFPRSQIYRDWAQEHKGFTGTTPLKCFVLVPLIQFLKMDRLLQTNGSHFGLLRRLSGQLLTSGRRLSQDVTKSLKNLRFLPVCIVRPFSGIFLQYIPIA